MRKILKYIGLIIILLIGKSCTKESEFQKIDFDWTIDIIESIGQNLNPNEKYEYWALLRSRNGGIERVDILNEKGNTTYRNLIDLSYSQEGFLFRGHQSTYAYYIMVVENGEVSKIKTTENLKLFLGKIDTMEEALLLTRIEEFGIDHCDERGSSYRKIKDGFEFYLMINNGFFENTQYLVSVKSSGIITSKYCAIYCEGKKECIFCQ